MYLSDVSRGRGALANEEKREDKGVRDEIPRWLAGWLAQVKVSAPSHILYLHSHVAEKTGEIGADGHSQDVTS